MKSHFKNLNFSKGVMAVFSIYAILFAGLYYSPFSVMVKWWERDDYSYCYLIPFIVLYLLWEKKNYFLDKIAMPDWKGMILLVIGIAFYWLGELGGEFYIIYLSSWFILVGICVLNMGIRKVKTIIFPLFFILTMFPLPNFFNFKITLILKIISSKLGVMMMQVYGMSAYREGNVIDLGFTKLQVVDACSGLRYLFPMIVLSILLAYFYKARWWKKLVLVLSSVPLTILTNSLRIALTGILSEKFGSKVVEGFFHDFEGWLIFMITLGILLGEMWILEKLFKNKDAIEIIDYGDKESIDAGEALKQGSVLIRPQFLVSVVLLSLTLGLTQGIEFREAVPMNRSFSEFPMKVGEWVGSRQLMELKFVEELDFSDYIMADYKDESGKIVNFYVAYYASQRKGESIHSPASCLRGGGWSFNQAGSAHIVLKDGSMMPVNRAVIEKAPVKQLSYYWFPSRDRILTNAYQMKLYNFWDALTRQRTDGSLVRVITLVYPDESLEAAEKRMQAFISDINPVLKEFLPR